MIQRVLSGDGDAYAGLVRGHQAPCCACARPCCATLAEDAAQEIFFKAYQALPSFRGRSAFRTWLYCMRRNK